MSGLRQRDALFQLFNLSLETVMRDMRETREIELNGI